MDRTKLGILVNKVPTNYSNVCRFEILSVFMKLCLSPPARVHVAYCSVIPWLSLTQSFCSLSDRTVTLVGGGVPGLLYTLCGPGGSSRLNLPHRTKS